MPDKKDDKEVKHQDRIDDKERGACPLGEHMEGDECAPDMKKDSVKIVPDVLPSIPRQDSIPATVTKEEYDKLKTKFNRLLDSLLANLYDQKHLDSLCPDAKFERYLAAVDVQRKLNNQAPKKADSIVPEPQAEAPPLQHTDSETEYVPYTYDYGFANPKDPIHKGELYLQGERRL